MKQDSLVRLLLEAHQDAVCFVAADGRVLGMNTQAERMLNYESRELVGRLLPITSPHSKGVGRSSDWLSAAPRQRWISAVVERKDGSEASLTVEMSHLHYNDLSGLFLRMRSHVGSPTSSPALENTKVTLASIFGGMADGLVLIDEQGTILLFSCGAERLFSISAEDAVGRNVKILMPEPYRGEHDGYLASYRVTGVRKIIGIGREVSGRRMDGSEFPMYLSIGEIWLDGVRYFVGITHDLTETKHVERRLSMLSAAVEQSPVSVLITGTDGRIEYVNRCFTRLTGYADFEVVGKNASILQSQLTTKERYRRLWETISAGGEWQGEIRDRRKNGELYWANETIAPLRDARGHITNYIAIQQDVTDQRKDKEALAASEERFRKVAQMVGEWLWEQDAEGRYTYSSEAVRDLLGLDPSDVIGKNYLSLFDKGSTPHAEFLSSSIAMKAPFHRVVNCYRRTDGSRVFTESTGTPLYDEDGRLIKWRGVDRDITARKEFEDALRVRNRAMESVHVGIVISDAAVPGNPNIYVNPALAKMTGYTQEELLSGGMHMLQGPGTDKEAVARIKEALSSGKSCEVTLLNYRKNGEPFWNELLIAPVQNETGEITHFVGVQTDITEKRRLEESRRDLEIAKQIQLSLLPDKPFLLADARIAGICLPATHVGGDYFDYFENSGCLEFVIADVSGHSVGAALIMTEVRSMVRAQTGRHTSSLNTAALLRELNRLLHDDLTRSELFITMFFCRYIPNVQVLEYSNAGHNPCLLLRFDDSECRALDSDGLVLGVTEDAEYELRHATLSPGDKLLFYTDGITEAQDPTGVFFGEERLRESFVANRRLPAEDIMATILQEVRTFCEPALVQDDMALLVLTIE